ncbi:MAG: hypothetical protein ACI841_003976 [Planctomycetota bacterium]|jgi:hypothetical protein
MFVNVSPHDFNVIDQEPAGHPQRVADGLSDPVTHSLQTREENPRPDELTQGALLQAEGLVEFFVLVRDGPRLRPAC